LIAIFRAKGESKTPLIVLALTGLLNVVLNLMFVLIMGMSVEGVALATAIANVVSFAVLLIKLRKDDDFTKFSFRKLKINVKEMKEIVTVGVPAAIQGALFAFSNVLIQSSIVAVNNRLCPVGSEYQPIVNGSAAAGNLMGFVYTAMNAVYQGAITFTSQNMGANKPERVKPIMYNCFVITSIIGLSFGLSVFFLRVPLLSLYGIVDGAEGSMEALAMYAATTRLLYECVPYFLCGIMETCTGVLRGLGRSALSTVISLIGACLLRVVWLWTVFPLFMTIESISISYSITWLLTASISFTFIQIIVRDLVKRKRISN
jgi:Na+-driven multidrug efflux pump